MTTTTHDILQQLEMQLRDTITINASRRHKNNLRLYLWMNGYIRNRGIQNLEKSLLNGRLGDKMLCQK